MSSSTSVDPLNKSALDTVHYNFLHLHDALTANCEQVNLVASLWGNRIYHSKSGLRGRFLVVIYTVLGWFGGNKFKLRRIEQVMLTTKKMFDELVKQREAHDLVFQTYLASLCEDREFEVVEDNVEKSRRQIRNFYQKCYPFLRLVKKSKQDSKNKTYCFLKATFKDTSTPFYDEVSHQSLKRSIRIMNLEGAIQGPLPLAILKQASTWTISSLPSEGHKVRIALRNWCKELNANPKVTTHLFHKALKEIVEYIKSHHCPNALLNPDLHSLELVLTKEGLTLFTLVDKDHLDWRNKVKKGRITAVQELSRKATQILREKKLLGKTESVSLGAEMNKKSLSKTQDENIVFELKYNDEVYPHAVLVIGSNREKLKLTKLVREKMDPSIPPANFIEIDEKGRFALVERLSNPLDSTLWASSKSLVHQDNILAQPIQKMIARFLRENKTPSNLSKQYLRFDQQRNLKSIKGCIPGPLDLIALDNFAFDFANENWPVYCYLIEPLLKHNQSISADKFFKVLLSKAVQQEAKPLEDEALNKEAALLQIEEAKIIERGKEFYKYVLKWREDFYKYIEDKYEIVNMKNFHEITQKQIVEFYGNSKAFGRLSLTFETLEEALLKNKKLMYLKR